jgi:flagellar hook assembly protein FlgD
LRRDLPVAPNPFLPPGTIRFALPPDDNGRVEIVDAAGRRVRGLPVVRLEEGQGSVFWDGRDESLRPVPAGLYFLQVRGPRAVTASKLLLIP